MQQVGKPQITDRIYRTDFGSKVLSFREILPEVVQEVLRVSTADADQYVEANLRSCWNYLLRREDSNLRRGLSPAFTVIDEVDKLLHWFPDPRISSRHSRIVASLRDRPAILRALDKIGDREFEALGCVVSEALGASHVHLTPGKKEGGVDFFAILVAPSPCHLLFGTTSPLRIVGQSKKYATAIDDDEMKSFITTLGDVHRLSPSVEDHVPTWFRAARGPVVGWFMTHNGLQSGASSRARNHGIIYSDSMDLAEILALSRKVPQNLTRSERVGHIRMQIESVLRRFPKKASARV